ncbi:MAG: ATP-binding protein [Geobacteraceae bacterium]|nr:ATP-binding protein [Geobacteraceae bacterium]
MAAQSRGNVVTFAMGGAVLAGLYLAKLYNYLLFHTLVEIFSVVVACGVFVIAWNARQFMANNYFLFVGIAFFFVGAVDFTHALAYKGMGVFPGYGANLPTQLWVVARYLQCSALLVAPLFLGRRLRPGLTVAAYLAATSLLLAAVFSGVFPDCFVEGEGLTPFKKGSEYLVALMLVGALVFMRKRALAFDREVVRLLSAALGVLISSELAFTLYTDVYGISNMVGHFLKFAGFYLLYKAIIETGLARPYDLLFRELKLKQEEVEILNTDLAARAAELEEANCELEATLNELEASNDELEMTNRELEAANQELEAFNYTVSHDLRSPITCITGYSQILLEFPADRLAEQGRGYVEEIQAAADRMTQLISTLLNFSRLSRSEINRTTVDLSELARAVAAQLRINEPQRRVAFTIAEGLVADGDSRLLRAVLENLIGNAWKYTGRRAEAAIEFGTTDCGGETAFFVRDNGAGFDMGEAGRLFVPFQRLHDREEFEGSGIGLATVRRIVERHGGRVWAEGEPGQGATFYFTLDRPGGAAHPAVPESCKLAGNATGGP